MFRYFINFFYLTLSALISIFLIFILSFIYLQDLPNFDKLSFYKPRLVSKIYTSNGNFLEDYSNENRIFAR